MSTIKEENQPKLSIITINLNNRAGLEQTIRSVVGQTFTDFEYIVIDGASTDGSVEVIKQYADRIDYWVSEPDKGIYNAMNKGIKVAKGEYLLFLNSGDGLYNRTTLEEVVRKINNEDIVFGNVISGASLWKPSHQLELYQVFKRSLPHQGSFLRRSLFDSIGYYNEKFRVISDWEFFMRAIFEFKCSYKYIDVIVAEYEKGGMSNNRAFNFKEKRKSLEIHFPDLCNLFFYTLKLEKELEVYKRSRLYKLVNPFFNKLRKAKEWLAE